MVLGIVSSTGLDRASFQGFLKSSNDTKARYWADPINKAAVPNTYTGKGGSKSG
jgi:hypothetical protein